MGERPNVLLITCDQLRGDSLGCYGHPIVETPHLDQLAVEGIRFTRAYAATPSCIAARASILTGMIPRRHGRVGYLDGVPFDYAHTLPGELARVGYHTQGVGKMHFYPPRNLCGFHHIVLHDGYLHCERKADKNYGLADDYLIWLRERAGNDADLIMHGLNANSWVARPWPYGEALHPTTWATSQAIDFLRRRDPTKPFFLWLSYVRPHAPLDPPQIYFDQYIGQTFPPVPCGDWADRETRAETVDSPAGILGERQLHRARAAYYAHITHIDHQIGRLLEMLGEYNLRDDTMIVFSSDHGELLGDHNLFRKGLPYEGSARVPLLVKPARDGGGKAGIVVDAPVELRDLMPTILAATGTAIPSSVDGLSLLPLMRGEAGEWRRYIHGEHASESRANHFITTGKIKYVWFSADGREQFFDLDNDPLETRDLIAHPANQADVRWCREMLVRELTGREEGYTDGERLIPGRKARPYLAQAGSLI